METQEPTPQATALNPPAPAQPSPAPMVKTATAEVEAMYRQELQSEAIRHYLRTGDLALMPDAEKDRVLLKMCAHFALDPILRPFILVPLNGKEVWYMTKAATDQVAAQQRLTRKITKELVDYERMVARFTAEVTDGNRTEEATSYIFIGRWVRAQGGGEPKLFPMQGEDLCNALMKGHTKAYRRATMAFIGGPLFEGQEDPIEVQTIQAATAAVVQLPSGLAVDAGSAEAVDGEPAEVANTVAGAPGEKPKRTRRTREQIEADAAKAAQAGTQAPASVPLAERVAEANAVVTERAAPPAVVDAEPVDVLATPPLAPAPVVSPIDTPAPVQAPAPAPVTAPTAAPYDPNVHEHKALFAEIVSGPKDAGGFGLPIAENVNMVREINANAFAAKVPATRDALTLFIAQGIQAYGAKAATDIF